ncbi:putative hydro-lyase [Paraburkholderia sabiae]|uniref:Hydro-lyase n=1 Tax=Paraburkholderia sabiae TaxID=273251 RepID=A0ABU9QLF7_9BURK|nr:putative hydro-lyase [Paraburkholderia sabiae]WJZ79264.1 putative hydro-lyase [Paraburkholderia sabiae]CAD6560763.1 Putative hydro-lyase [Paraburkholderia sabiae]
MLREQLSNATGKQVRKAIREREWTRTTHGLARSYVQANLAIVPEQYAFDFLRFCQRNPKPCPLLEVSDPGNPEMPITAPGSDIRTDLPGYRVYRNGALIEEVPRIEHLWRKDHVSFILGCSLSFDEILTDEGIAQQHLKEENGRIAVYKTNIECQPAGVFKGPMVVGMRPIARKDVARAIEITSHYPLAHGGPVHVGDGRDIGINDATKVDWGRYTPPSEDEIEVYWACGVTPQAIAMASGIPEMITHSAGHMFVTDIKLSAIRT